MVSQPWRYSSFGFGQGTKNVLP